MILWIDDDLPSLAYYEPDVAAAGFTITMVSRVDEVLAIANAHAGKWEAIIMDVMMPTGRLLDFVKADAGYSSGVEMASQLRNNSLFSVLRDVPIIFLTINTGPSVVDYAKQHQISVLRKDLATSEQLVSKLRSISQSGQR